MSTRTIKLSNELLDSNSSWVKTNLVHKEEEHVKLCQIMPLKTNFEGQQTTILPMLLNESVVDGELHFSKYEPEINVAKDAELKDYTSCTTSTILSDIAEKSLLINDSHDIVPKEKQTSVKTFSRSDVTHHADISSCWIIIRGKVYDITSFIKEHPGGEEILLEHAGWDATMSFSDVGHSKDAQELLSKYFIGILDEADDSTRKIRHDTV